jgi:riboflavin kinase/FMN adenylyltransferase
VNSSLIRDCLEIGDIATANELLGRPYALCGNVVAGDQRGRLLGYPTANIDLGNSNKLIPKNGIYFVRVNLDAEKHFGMASIGERPTFHTNGKRTVEAHILDFNKDIYDRKIKVEFLQRLRNEEKFESAEKLIDQMNIDREISIKLSREF